MQTPSYSEIFSFIEQNSLSTPLTFYSERRIHDALSVMQSTLGETSNIYYALKSCYNPHVLRSLSGKIGVEVMSEFEYNLARRYGFTSIVLNGMGRSTGLIQKAVADGAVIIIDSLKDIATLKRIATRQKDVIRIGFRLRISLPELAETNSYVAQDHPLGNNLETDFSQQFFRLLAEHSNIRWCMLHVHVAINEASPTIYLTVMEQIRHELSKVEATHGYRPEIINIGGGFEVYSSHHIDSFKSLFETIRNAFEKLFPSDYILAVEPGRFLTAHSGFSVGRVLDIKEIRNKHWIITDIGTNTLIPIPNARYTLASPEPSSDGPFTVGITDGITSPSNNIVREAVLDQLPVIDSLICIENTGAYTDVYSTFWAYPPHVVYWIDTSGKIMPYRTTDDIKEMYRLYFKVLS